MFRVIVVVPGAGCRTRQYTFVHSFMFEILFKYLE